MTSLSSEPLVHTEGGTFDEGLANGYQLLERYPSVAVQQAQTLLRLAPDARAFALLAAAYRRLDKDSEAKEAELSGIRASFSIPRLNEAAVAGQEGSGARARTLIEAFLDAQPENLLALTMAAELDIEEWKFEVAEKRLRAVLERAPDFLRATMLLGRCLSAQARISEAIAVYQGVLARKPDNSFALRALASAHSEANRHADAAEDFRRLLELDPSVNHWVMYAQELRMLGRKDESVAAFRRALEVDPNSGAAWWGLAYYFPFEVTDGDVEAMKAALADVGESSQDGGPIHVALGLIAERQGDYAEAFRNIALGKKLRASGQPAAGNDGTHVDELIRALTPERFAELAGGGSMDNSPIFIIGMPRSGTTLLERILGGHSQIEAAGELPIIARMASAGAGSSANNIGSMTREDLTRLGNTYIERSREYRPGQKPRFIDKMNSNWFRVGLIRMMLPNARIIDLRRNAVDCCWSNFRMLFAEGTVAANDQRDIARFYRNYVRMVDAVNAVAPGGILRVNYEELVDDVEGETRRILDFLGLDYEPRCIDSHLATEAVATPSSEQVRRPINREGIGSAEPYRHWLRPMIEELGDLAS